MNNNLIASDSFASGSLNPNWTAIHGFTPCQIVVGSPNVAESGAAAGVDSGQQWNGGGFGADQISEFTLNYFSPTGTTNYAGLWVRLQSGVVSGYKMICFNSSCNLYRYDNGTPTPLTSAGSAVTVAAGDVWSLVARGGFLIVFQNYNQILYWADPTYTTGVPGFSLQVATTASDIKVSSWRGYGCNQQDGVWTKKSVAVPFKSGYSKTTAPTGNGTFTPAQILYEGGAKILSGTVFKMWYTSFDTTNQFNICYAESTDGINYTSYASNPVIGGYATPNVIKNGATYYLYCQQGSAFGTGNINLYTSTDGVTWSSVSTTVLALGTTGAWDSSFMYAMCPIAIISGTWYALYSAGNDPTGHEFFAGLATSTDGVHWTKYASNPVINNFYATQAFANVGPNWFIWGGANQPGQFSGSDNLLDPNECVRLECTDGTFINWTNRVNSLHHSNCDENVNGNSGQSYFCCINELNGVTYGIINGSVSDNTAPTDYQLVVATVPTTIANLVANAEDAVKQIASDAFTNGPGPLSANWTTLTGNSALQIVAGPYAEPSAINVNAVAYYSGATFANDQYSEITIHTLAANNYAHPCVRCQPGANSYYYVFVQGATGSLVASFTIYKRVAGSDFQLSPVGSITLQSGDKIRVSVTTGSNGFPVLSAYQNGFLIRQTQDYNNTFATGYPGFRMRTNTTLGDAQVSSWAGGNANVLPYPTGLQPYLPLLGCGA